MTCASLFFVTLQSKLEYYVQTDSRTVRHRGREDGDAGGRADENGD